MATLTATWTPQAPSYEYKITGPDPTTTLVASGMTPNTTISVGGLIGGETYSFWVRGVYGSGVYSAWSSMSGIVCVGFDCTLTGGTAVLIISLAP
jgi:hypothetical protein